MLPEDAKSILSDAHPKHHFKIHMGTSIKNLQELAEALEIMDDATFKHHVTKEKNDFYNWVKGIITDFELSKQLLKAKTRKQTYEVVRKRVNELLRIQACRSPIGYSEFFTNEFFLGVLLGLIFGFIISAIINGLI